MIIGLTGGIGSGKSSLAVYLQSQGWAHLDADVISRSLVQPGEPAYQAILEHFGQEILDPIQHIDRKKLGALVFEQPTQKAWLEALLHPLIRRELESQALALKQQAISVIVSIPLLIESLEKGQDYAWIEHILVVDCPVEIQIQRTHERDGKPLDLIEKIIAQQARRETRLKWANSVITNTNGLAQLHQAADRWMASMGLTQ